jgi:hypothetical protein
VNLNQLSHPCGGRPIHHACGSQRAPGAGGSFGAAAAPVTQGAFCGELGPGPFKYLETGVINTIINIYIYSGIYIYYSINTIYNMVIILHFLWETFNDSLAIYP